MVRVLERKPCPSDAQNAADDAEAEFRLKLEFHVFAASRWVEHNGLQLYSSLDGLET